jgi:predicted membrane channel-forming protein YqfA (hemolysin III family)
MRCHSVGSRIAPESFLIAGLQMRTIITSSQLYQQKGRANMLFRGGFTYTNFLADVLSVFIFVLWFWLLITVFGDLFRRRDVSGLGKALWVIVLIVFPYLGIFIYLISQSRGMAERHNQRVEQARGELRQIVGFSVADEIEKLERLKKSGAISSEEYASLRARAIQ